MGKKKKGNTPEKTKNQDAKCKRSIMVFIAVIGFTTMIFHHHSMLVSSVNLQLHGSTTGVVMETANLLLLVAPSLVALVNCECLLLGSMLP